MLGSAWEQITIDDVVFERCRMDYAAFIRLRAAGSVIFAGCSLREARFGGCDLSDAAFEECNLYLTEFDGGTYRGCDLRGNDLSGLRGVGALKKVIVDRSQLPGLAQALAADLEISVD